MSVRDFSGTDPENPSPADILRVRSANLDLTFQTPWGASNNSGWEMRFTNLEQIPVPAAGWLILPAAASLIGVTRRRRPRPHII
jgi:hypothetical protein